MKHKNKNWEVSVKQERQFYNYENTEGSQFLLLVLVPDILGIRFPAVLVMVYGTNNLLKIQKKID
jgi:hypothetical protein